ncbi:MAG: pirin family protein [Anaerolineae bacterium]
MLRIIPAAERHYSDAGWLKTYWLFSFSDYFDPDNVQFGALRVFNDDIVAGDSGFPSHRHREMEIITLVHTGELTHRDSSGGQGVILPGEVQRMSAGTGVIHSERNAGSEPVHLFQIWLVPDLPGLEPSYDQRRFEPDQWHNRLLAVASGQGIEGAVPFHTAATIYRAELDTGVAVEHATDAERRVFIYNYAGRVALDGSELGPGDQARISQVEHVRLEALEPAALVLIDAPPAVG